MPATRRPRHQAHRLPPAAIRHPPRPRPSPPRRPTPRRTDHPQERVMPNLPPTYVSPWARWSLVLEEHPTATHGFTVRRGTDFGIPATFGGDADYCVAEVRIPGREPVIGYKALTGVRDADQWNTTC